MQNSSDERPEPVGPDAHGAAKGEAARGDASASPAPEVRKLMQRVLDPKITDWNTRHVAGAWHGVMAVLARGVIRPTAVHQWPGILSNSYSFASRNWCRPIGSGRQTWKRQPPCAGLCDPRESASAQRLQSSRSPVAGNHLLPRAWAKIELNALARENPLLLPPPPDAQPYEAFGAIHTAYAYYVVTRTGADIEGIASQARQG